MSYASLCLLALMLSACTLRAPHTPTGEALPASVPGQQLYGTVIDLRTQRPVSLDTMADVMVQADVVAFGEEHDHPEIQTFALRLLQALAQRRPERLALAMEFLERDQQHVLDEYLSARIDAETFQKRLGASEGFMQYYVPLLDYARQQRLPVLAMNLPRAIARQVARAGLQPTLSQLSAQERAYLPEDLASVSPDYRRYFLDAVATPHPVQGEQAERFVTASHLKDATMAAVLASFLAQRPGWTVFALAGRFHTDYGKAIPALLRQRRQEARIISLTARAVDAEGLVDLGQFVREEIANYLWCVPPVPARPPRRTPRTSLQPAGAAPGDFRIIPAGLAGAVRGLN